MTTKPNVIFFFSDQQRWDTCGCYGQTLPITPNLDRLAKEGVQFMQAYTCQPLCGPARAALQTGQWPTAVGCQANNTIPPAETMRLAPAFQSAGYETGYIGKWHLASNDKVNHRTSAVPPAYRGGYEYWLGSDSLEHTSHSYDGHMFDNDGNRREFPPNRFRADVQTDWVIEYLRSRDVANGVADAKPFFLMASYIEPHQQNDHQCYEGPHGSKERWANYKIPGDLIDADGDWQENFPDYLGCCHSLDENLGRIRAALEELNLWDNTILLYSSDHGSHFWTRNSEYKRSCHDACTHIPLIAAGGPFSQGGEKIESLVSLIDVPPTLLAAVGAEVPDAFAGKTLTNLLDGPPTDWPNEVYMQISESHCGRAIRTSRYTYAVGAPPEVSGWEMWSDMYYEAYLYDNHIDPHQRINLVADPNLAELREQLRAQLLARIAAAGEPIPEILPAQIKTETK